jgi:hypothetical protein
MPPFFYTQNLKFVRYISMIHLSTSASSQTMKIIPRSYASTINMILRDDSTNTSTTYSSISTSTDKNYLVIAQALSPVLVEGRFYDMTIKEGTAIIYKDKIFCTDQTVNQENNDYYSVNSGEYTTEDSYDNDYIII